MVSSSDNAIVKRFRYLVGIPCLYGADHTRMAIDSVVYQENTDLLLIDNGAEPEVKQLISSYKERSNVSVIHNEENIFVNPAWNQIIDHFLKNNQYDYLLIMNSDLILKKNWNKLLDYYFSQLPDVIPLPVIVNDSDLNKFDTKLVINHMEVEKGTPGVLIVLNRKHAEMIYPIPDYIKIWFGDNWIFENLRALGYKTVIPYNLISYHAWSKNVSRLPGAHDIIEEDKKQWAQYAHIDMNKLVDKFR
jgi:hypothetical protein